MNYDVPWNSTEMMLQNHYKQKGAALLETIKIKLNGDTSFPPKKNMVWEEIVLSSWQITYANTIKVFPFL